MALAFVVLSSIALVLWWLSPGRHQSASEPVASTRAAAVLTSPPQSRSPDTSNRAAPTSVPAAGPAIIDSISIEKSRVCEGEENLVTVKARISGQPGEQPRVIVGHTPGAKVPLRVWLNDQGEPSVSPVVHVGNPGEAVISQPVPYYRVERCPPRPYVVVAAQQLPNRLYTFRLVARVVEAAAQKGGGAALRKKPQARPVAYAWDIGDGVRRPGDAELIHDFEAAADQSEFNYALVTVEVRLADGSKLNGRTSIELLNPARHFEKQGFTMLVAVLNPLFPELDKEGKVVQQVRLRHYEDHPVEVTHVELRTHYASGSKPGERNEDIEPSPPKEVSPAQVLGTGTIPPGKGVEFTVVLDTELEPDTLFRTYTVQGRSASGRPAQGSFSLMRPPPEPNAENSLPVEDPLAMATIQRGMQLLGKSSVTLSDLQTLARQGAFDDLKPTSAPASTTARSP